MESKFLDIVLDETRLKKELLFYSLFLMVFENFVSNWKETITFFYSNGFTTDEKNGEPIYFVKTITKEGNMSFVKDKQAEKEFNDKVFHLVKNTNGNYNPKLSMFKWMSNNSIIDKDDYEILSKCYDKRNEYAHGIAQCLERYVTKEEKDLLKSLMQIGEKASKNWFYEIELPTTPSEELEKYVDDNGTYIPPDDVITGINIFYSLLRANLNDIFS